MSPLQWLAVVYLAIGVVAAWTSWERYAAEIPAYIKTDGWDCCRRHHLESKVIIWAISVALFVALTTLWAPAIIAVFLFVIVQRAGRR